MSTRDKLDRGHKEINDTRILHSELSKLNILLDMRSGNIEYSHSFRPFKLNFDLIFVRHGETYGNAGQTTKTGTIDEIAVKNGIRDTHKRIFQGNVDSTINQLTAKGKIQAQYAAERIKSELIDKGWHADVILSSPLKRAQETATIFSEKYHTKDISIHEGLCEISFGSWDNRRICDLDATDKCHLFYLKQNALVKETGLNGHGQMQTGENFCELLLRVKRLLCELNDEFSTKNIIMFSHSMLGAACAILLGKGTFIEDSHYLAFDGTRSNGTPYTIPYATPIIFHKQNQ